MRGRKPKPNAIHAVNGNPGRRPRNEHEPIHKAVDATCPAELVEPTARAEWERLIVGLKASGHITQVDRAALMGYCMKYGQWLALEAEAAKHAFIVKAPSGYPIPNPALGMANRAYNLMLRTAAELGITPSARSRVVAVGASEDDAFAQFQQQRPSLRRVK